MPASYLIQPYIFPERFRFLAFGGTGFKPVSAWSTSGYQLCAEAYKLATMSYLKTVPLSIVSDRRGWFTSAQATADVWAAFLHCSEIEPWASHFNGYHYG